MDQRKIGRFLKTLRGEKGVTQAELAEGLGVSDRSVSRWETGATMPDFDLLMELASYYEVEVGEILDGERKAEPMDKGTEELLGKVADYNNVERGFFSKRMCVMFALALVGQVVLMTIYAVGLERIQPYATVVGPAFGLMGGALATGLVYASRYIVKLKAARERLSKRAKRNK